MADLTLSPELLYEMQEAGLLDAGGNPVNEQAAATVAAATGAPAPAGVSAWRDEGARTANAAVAPPAAPAPSAPAPTEYDLGNYAGRQAYREQVLKNDPNKILAFNESFHRGEVDLGNVAGRDTVRQALGMSEAEQVAFNNLFHVPVGKTFAGFGPAPLSPDEIVRAAANLNLISSGPGGSAVSDTIRRLGAGTPDAIAGLRDLMARVSTPEAMGQLAQRETGLRNERLGLSSPRPPGWSPQQGGGPAAPAGPGAGASLTDLLSQFLNGLFGVGGQPTPAAAAAKPQVPQYALSPLGDRNRQAPRFIPQGLFPTPSTQQFGNFSPAERTGTLMTAEGLGIRAEDLLDIILRHAPPAGNSLQSYVGWR